MVLKHGTHLSADFHRLLRVAEEIANQAHPRGVIEFHQHDQIGPLVPQCRMHRVPNPLVTVDQTVPGDGAEAEIV